MVNRLRLSRSQIAKIMGNDPEAIKQFERLFAAADDQATVSDETTILAGSADTKAGQALDQLQRIADALEVLALAPVGDDDTPVGDIAPPVVPAASVDPLTPPVVVVPGDDWLQPTPQSHVIRNAYGWFASTADQTAAAINTATAMTFNTTFEAQDIAIGSPASRIVVSRQGIMNIQFSAQFQNTAGGAHQVWVWLRVNGTDVPNSSTVLRIEGNNTEQVAAWNFLQRFTAGDYFELMWEVSDVAVALLADPATAVHPAVPSILLSVTDNINP